MMWNKTDLDFIEGGLSGPEGATLQGLALSVAAPGMVGFEIGCYTGWTASQVLPIFKEHGGKYFLIDWFRGNVETAVGPYAWDRKDFDSPRVLLSLLGNLELQGFDSVSNVIVGGGRAIAPLIKDASVDYIYIGADHRYTEIKADLSVWAPKLKPSGILCGHGNISADFFRMPLDDPKWIAACAEKEIDYYEKYSSHFGIIRALRELYPGRCAYGARIWWIEPLVKDEYED